MFHPISHVSPKASPISPSLLGARSAGETMGGRIALDDRTRGLFIHRLLRFLPELPKEERLSRAGRFLPDVAEEQRHPLVQEALSVIDQPALAPFFSSDSLAEVEVTGLLASGAGAKDQRRILGRVDRLAFHKDELLVADYKTDRHPPGSLGSVPRGHLLQLDAYRQVLSSAFPDLRLRLFLIWTVNGRVMELDVDSFVDL